MVPSSVSAFNVEYLTRLTAAVGALEARIRDYIPKDIPLKDRTNRGIEISKGDKGYQRAFDRFSEEVSDNRSIVILTFLYQFEKYLNEDMNIFTRQYAEFFLDKPTKWEMVKYNFPKIDQTTLSIILGDLSDTIIGYRLEDLARIGLVERSLLKPPHPKHVCISTKGIAAIEAAIRDGISCLAPMFGNQTALPPESSSTPPEQSPTLGREEHRPGRQ